MSSLFYLSKCPSFLGQQIYVKKGPLNRRFVKHLSLEIVIFLNQNNLTSIIDDLLLLIRKPPYNFRNFNVSFWQCAILTTCHFVSFKFLYKFHSKQVIKDLKVLSLQSFLYLNPLNISYTIVKCKRYANEN